MSSQQSTPTAHATPLASPGEAMGVACAVGVDCWEDIVYVVAPRLQRVGSA